MKNMKKLAALVLAAVMTFSTMVTPAKAEEIENTGYTIANAEPRNMPTPYACVTLFDLYDTALTSALFDVFCSGTVNVQNGDVITAEARILHNSSLNMDTYDFDVRTSISGSQVTIYITGTIDFKYTHPSTGMTVKRTRWVDSSVVVYPNDYIN